MGKEYKVFKIENEDDEITYVFAENEVDCIAVYCYDMGAYPGDLAKATITEFPKENWKDVMIISNEPTEMPDMTIEQWVNENTPYQWSEHDYSQVICSTEWID